MWKTDQHNEEAVASEIALDGSAMADDPLLAVCTMNLRVKATPEAQ